MPTSGPCCFNTGLWVVLVPLFAAGFGLLYAVLVDRAFG